LDFSSSLANDNDDIRHSVKKNIEINDKHILNAVMKPDLGGLLKALTQSQNVDEEDDLGYTALFYAIANKNIEQIETLLQNGANPSHQTKHRITPLFQAIVDRSFFICNLLIKYGANVNQRCLENLQTPLHLAAMRGAVDMVKTLVNSGANLHKVDLDGSHPIHLAASQGHLSLVKLMLTMGASLHAKDYTGKTLVHYAAESNNAELIEFLKSAGLSVQKPTKIKLSSIRKNRYQREGVTPLHISASNRRPIVTRQLIDAGADLNAFDKYERGILFHTVTGGKVEVLNIFTNLALMDTVAHRINAIQGAIRKDAVQYLEILYNDTPLDLCLESNGATALHTAVLEGSRRCVHYLLKNGADPLKAALIGETPFDVAVKTERLTLARYISKKTPQLDLHRKLKDEKTYLHIACEKNDVEMASWLIFKGLSVDEVDNHGLSSMHYAAKQGSQPLMHLFLAVGGDPFKLTLQKQSLVELLPKQAQALIPLIQKYESERIRYTDRLDSKLHMAIRLDDVKHFSLFSRKENINHRNRAGKTPLHMSVLHDNPYFFLNLIEAGADLELLDHKGRTPLFLVVSKGWNLDYIQSLLKLNANLMTTDIKGRTLFEAILDRKDDIEFSLELFDLLFKHLPEEEMQNPFYSKLREQMVLRLEEIWDKKTILAKLFRNKIKSEKIKLKDML
jgi:ankyrin repeat protein